MRRALEVRRLQRAAVAAAARTSFVQSPSVSSSRVAPGATFTLSATVRNQGNGSSAATTLRYYRSTDATVNTSDTQVGTDAVSGLAAGNVSAESINLTAPSSSGTYYYGACVDAVSESPIPGTTVLRPSL